MKRTARMTFQRQERWFEAHRRSIELDEVMYEPFWRVEDVRSSGIKTKIAHFSTPNRVMHLLSQNELWMYLSLVQMRYVVEIYEQFAIPLEFSVPIAKQLGVKHPVYVGSKQVPIVQTIDFVSTLIDGSRIAHPVKQESDSLRERTVEKLAIQQAYCELEHIDYQLVTESE
ncbi:TnsA endonuclease N-terminal domain-containing protein [Shewanella sp. 3_MG-2023]|uniref:TnsA endonuclease N-terminal domain-containing protein n=1 Tax=Shewanella sp. 3_MG-2023 TaxID=3062635 RepID=UPI0026E25A05|nr:TnsA endonuclease N-terminal domain-containing protein [Shewanella sp. 3_MG-2023]MDO6777372.1 TnsA endonuclease N-terminal domain-containing protein [Shewanella sp. 3_MG-2023]